jgi:hypothetical protein
MTRDLSAVITTPAAPYVVPARLAGWIPFIRVADFQKYPAGKIAETLAAQGVKASPDDVRSILAAYKGKRHAVPVAEQLDSAAADIAALKARGLSEHRICFWLAINRGMAIHQCQLNTWTRTRRNKADM